MLSAICASIKECTNFEQTAMKKLLLLIAILLTVTAKAQTNAQTDTSKTNLIKYLNLTGEMLSKSTGYEIKYDANGDGNPVDLKYTPEKRLSYFASASEGYLKVTSYYNTISKSLTQKEKEDFETIDNALSKIIKDAEMYIKMISKQTLTLSLEDIFPTITFIEIVKAKIEKFEKAILK